MDYTERKIPKIAREAAKLAVLAMKENGIGTAEYDFIHAVRHHPGITQAELREQLNIDKGSGRPAGCPSGSQGYCAPGQSRGRRQPAALRHGAGPGAAELQGPD